MKSFVSIPIRRVIRLWCFIPLLAVLVFACQKMEEVEPVFDKTASERVQERANELRVLLQSSEHGWEVDYRPATGEAGVFSFIFEFISDTTVETLSDFAEEFASNISRSEYDIVQGSTTKLSFNTGGIIHKLSDAAHSPIPGEGGSGLRGDFEFLYYGTNEEGNIIFRTNRRQDTLIFRKAIFESRSDLRRSFRSEERLASTKAPFQRLSYSNGDATFESAVEFSVSLRTVEIRRVLKAQDSSFYATSYTSAIDFTPTGIRLDSIIGSDEGDVLKNVELTYDESSGAFLATLDKGVTVVLKGQRTPLLPIIDHKIFLDRSLTFGLVFIHDALLGFSSKSFNDFFGRLISLAPGRFDPPVIRLLTKFPISGGEVDFVWLPGSGSVHNFPVLEFLVYEDEGDHMKISRAGVDGTASWFSFLTRIDPSLETDYDRLMNVLADPQGFYVEDLGRKTRFPNHVYRFISVGDPSIQIAFYHVPR